MCNCLDECASNYNAEADGYTECVDWDQFDPKEYSRFFNTRKGFLMHLQISASGELKFVEKSTIDDGCTKKTVYQLTVINESNKVILDTELMSSGPYLRAPNNIMKFDSVYFGKIDIPHAVECIGYWENELCDVAFNWRANCGCEVTNLIESTVTPGSIEFNLFQ